MLLQLPSGRGILARSYASLVFKTRSGFGQYFDATL